MKWTHKVVYEKTGQWWMTSLVDGTFFHSKLHEEGEPLTGPIENYKSEIPSVESYYNMPGYRVIKLKAFKGNL